jgi:hypothetical protein
MRYITLGAIAGISAGYTVEAFFPFKPMWGVTAIVVCLIIGIIIQCRVNKKGCSGIDTEQES